MDARRREPLLVSTNFAEAEKLQIAFLEGFRRGASNARYVFLGVTEQLLLDADIEAAHMQKYCTDCASGGLRSAAAAPPADERARCAGTGGENGIVWTCWGLPRRHCGQDAEAAH